MRSRQLALNIVYLIIFTHSALARAEAVIAGTVQAKDECAQAPMEAWLSAGTTLLYQVEIPEHGSFEFHVNSGKYNLVVIGATGCLSETEVEARENDTRRLTLVPTPAAKPPEKHSALDWLISSAQAAYWDCPTCNQNSWYVAPPVSFMQMQSPWWLPYGAMTYPNFSYPGPWSGGGITGSMFPNQGGMFAAKPVLYVNGPDGTAVKIRAQLASSTHWLVAVPEHGEKAWSGSIDKNAFRSDDATYRYLFYDYRADQKKFQDSRGFCAGRGDLIERLSDALKASGFKKNEIEDFSNFWRFKIPQSERYCVYPQSNAELEPSVHLEISPKPAVFTQLLMIVQIGENLDGKGKFRRAPVASWVPETPTHREPAAQTAPAPAPAPTPAGIEVREWGVGFLEGTPGAGK